MLGKIEEKVIEVPTDTATMRYYDTGATRNNNTKVLQRYLEYLGKHRVQADGKLRDWDNC